MKNMVTRKKEMNLGLSTTGDSSMLYHSNSLRTG